MLPTLVLYFLISFSSAQRIIHAFKGLLFFPVHNVLSGISRTHLKFRPKTYSKCQLLHSLEGKVISGSNVPHNTLEVVGETSKF